MLSEVRGANWLGRLLPNAADDRECDGKQDRENRDRYEQFDERKGFKISSLH